MKKKMEPNARLCFHKFRENKFGVELNRSVGHRTGNNPWEVAELQRQEVEED